MTVRWIVHRGMAAGRPGGTPTRQTLQRAIDLNPALVEVDVHTTADGILVIRHDNSVSRWESIAKLTYRQLKLADPVVMTLDEVDRFVAGRARLLLDLKGARTVLPLAAWLGQQPHSERYVVCLPRLADFETFQAKAPDVERWPTFPDVGTDVHIAFRRALTALVHRRQRGELNQIVRDVVRAVRDIVRDRHAALKTIGGMPWRDGLPKELGHVVETTKPSGISVHQWLVTPALVDAAHLLGLTVTAWTVNRADALAAVIRAGVDYVTTDDPEAMRLVLPRARRLYRPLRGARPQSPLSTPSPVAVPKPSSREVA